MLEISVYKKQYEKPKGKLIWERSSQSNASQATNDQSKNGASGKMLQETQEELTVPLVNNINPLQADVKPESEKNQENLRFSVSSVWTGYAAMPPLIILNFIGYLCLIFVGCALYCVSSFNSKKRSVVWKIM